MAAEVPVKDVLCEAMEYLCKLGSNLRARTENLKEKKIRKDKLSNVLAVQKAASKVLLICELSKKSLENVEVGIRKVLQQVDASQTKLLDSNGGKHTGNKERSESEDKTKYYIDYKSRKLRISRKINMKHYTSVKVMAKNMSMSMLEKYPVHYDCKLYRLRKKIEKRKLDRSLEAEINASKITGRSDSENSHHKEQRNDGMNLDDVQNHDLCETSDRIPIETETHKSDVERTSPSKEISNDNDSVSDNAEEGQSTDNVDKNIKSKSDEKELLEHVESCNSKSVEKEHVDARKSKSVEKEHVDARKSNSVEKEHVDSRKSNSVEREHVDSSKSKSVEKEHFDPLMSESVEKEHDSDNSDIIKIKSKNDSRSKRRKRLLSDSSEKDSKNSEEKCPNKSKLNIESDSSEDVIVISNPQPAEKQDMQDSNDGSNESKSMPRIQCVSLTKLLKPGVLKNEGLLDNKENTTNSRRSLSLIKQKDKRDKIKKKLENEYWAEKRKEVKAFKPKKCTVKIRKLPKFSKEYLVAHNLKKIVQNGTVVFELESTIYPKHDKSNEEKSVSDDDIISKVTEIKNQLLNQSDSESDISTKDKTERLSDTELIISIPSEEPPGSDTSKTKEKEHNTKKKSLNEENKRTIECKEKSPKPGMAKSLEKTDGEENRSERDLTHDQSEKGQSSGKSPAKESENQQSREITPENEEENAKKYLLNESPDDITHTPLKNRQERKKHMRESIKAKKMLLTYSSSETEDEELKNVFKEIKASLLKDISDDEIELKTKVGEKIRNELDSHDSDLSSIEIGRRKNKIKREMDSSSEDMKRRSKKMVRSKSKPGNCSSQNSDARDSNDRDIDSLSNLNTLNKTRRRNSNGSDENSTSGEVQGDRRARDEEGSGDLGEYFESTGLIDNEVILGAESESEGASGEEAADDDLPQVSMPGFNGDPMQHLVKEDLLGESDSSVSHNEKSSDNANKDDTDEDAKLNSKRRKGNAISSDSEAGSSRKKDKVRVSDFEDSEDESSEPVKKAKRKKGSDSDGSNASSTDGGNKKKRRRIKQINDSDGSGSETETEGRNKHGRKNIRKVMGKNQLEEATKKAARQEKERIARIAERQKLYNNMEFDESGKPDEVVLEKVVLDFDPETKEPLIQVDRGLVKKLKPHQANGIKFMWDACFESVKRIKKDKGSGCILAHCMGLGKTLQVVSLTHTLLTHGSLTKVKRVLVVCPLSTVLNWVNEFNMWLKHAHNDYEVDVYELSRFKQNSERAYQLSQWFEHGGVCVLGYEMFRNLSADNSKKFKKKMLKNFQEALVDPGPDLVVCDEGHLLKNEKTSLSQSMNRVKTLRRIVLTGTPLQNNLKEYYCMVQFVKPNLLGKYNEYLNRFVNPITNGQYTDSTEHDIKIMKRRSHVLHKMLDGAVQRRDYGVLAPFLPPKHEYVLFITLTEVQIKLYQYYLDNFSRKPLPGKSSGFLFPDFQSLQRIWTHPLVLKYNSERYEIMQQKKREREEEESEGSLADFIADDSTPEETSTEESTEESDMSDDSRKKSKNKKSTKKNKTKECKVSTRRGTRANPIEQDDEMNDDDIVEIKNENPTEWWIKLVSEDELEDMRNSHKLILLFDILRQCEAIGDKLLVFSQSLYSLDLIEHFLGKVDEATQEGRIDEKLGGHVGSWSPGIDYFRLDGSTSCENRSIWCKNFNREDNPRARLFLISTRAGGLGINLVAANRVVIFDVSWNPSHDVQSIFRVYRFGQKKPCYIYRFLAMGTMEEKIYERQVTKQAISKRVIDEQQIDRHYAENDLAELYKFEPRPPSPRALPPLPKDRLFAEMLKEHEAQIYKYHEHDSLLENKEEETLSEEERKAAWEDFENEKNRPPPTPFVSPWTMHNGLGMTNLLQQQQYAYAALAAMLRKDMPNINDNQIRDLLPLLYNTNNAPGSMQKMNDLYKYTQMGMMNPSMMNPMNSASGAGGAGGMGGSSGLQYEPPWQRQQQQQQQMRLQQLIQQQQNQMGAKLYAGGLGSRDPVAMALQQQRAREIMLGGAGSGRPRGRPPLQPRPPPAPHDVVNLDSD